MATPGTEAAVGEIGHLSPTLLRDEEGNVLVPTEVPPAIDFNDLRSPRARGDSMPAATATGEEIETPEAPIRTSAEDTDSYFDAKPASAKLRPVKKSDTDPQGAPGASRPKPPQQWGTEQPRSAPTKASLLGSTKRRATANEQARAPYSYTFDPLPSDSDSSSSSSSEEEAPIRRRRHERRQRANQAAESGEPKEKKHRHGLSRFAAGNEHYKTKGRISKRDGRLNISINETANSGYIAKALGQSIRHHLDIPHRRKHEAGHDHEEEEKLEEDDEDAKSIASTFKQTVSRPRMNIVIMVIGSRGDIQPFLKIGRILKDQHGHRVRIATHPAFREFINDAGLEFFSVGGDPSELMAFMVKNPGLIPSMQTVKEGEIAKRRKAMAEMFEGFWRACINATDDEHDVHNSKLIGDKSPFVADAIIANPPSFAHVHIAERLGVPLHMMFTFPYSPTQAFPHPLANIKPQKSNVDAHYVNFMSYPLVEMMTWQGLGDLVNRFRQKTLGLEPVSSLWAPGALYRMKVPYTYMWSPSLVPKPKDWGPEIDLAGFVFLDLASDFRPPQDLQDFLNAGEPPVYIGFGSIVVDDPDRFTQMIFKAARMAGVRALVNKGWGGLGGEGNDTPDNIYMLGNTPHDWLFPKCKAVVHHGGAGTTAIGLKCAKPTMIVPFFGDQPFWGAMVAEAKAGAHQCIPYKKLTAERLAEGIKQCLLPESQQNVQKIANSIAVEGDGAENAVKSFHRSLPLSGRRSMRCSILEDRVAIWQLRGSSLRLSALAAELLVEKNKCRWQDLKLLRHYEWNDFDGPGEPFTGGGAAMASSLYGIGEGVGMVPVRIANHVHKREKHERKRREIERRKEERRKRKAERAQVDQRLGEGAQAQTHDGSADYEDIADANVDMEPNPQLERMATTTTLTSVLSADPTEPFAHEMAGDIGDGVKRSGKALITMPMDLHMAIAQGFHNAPRLYGDATVRKPIRITGVKSGAKAARKEFAHGIYDGVTGLVTQPIGGWKDEVTLPAKMAGFGKGLGKGIGGFVLKDISAVVAPPAFLGMGMRKYLEKKMGGPGTNAFIRKAQIIQGYKDRQALMEQDKEGDGKDDQIQRIQARVDEGWRVYQDIWDTEHHYRAASGRGPLGSIRLKREKKRWEKNGALENVDTADRALKARKEGRDLDRLFKHRKRELRRAEEPRAPAMEQPEPYEHGKDVLTNGQKERTIYPLTSGNYVKAHTYQSPPPKRDRQREDSESTAVATPEDDEANNGNASSHDTLAGEKLGGGIAGHANLADNGRLTV